MNEKYVEERLLPQITYYDSKSSNARKMYYRLAIANIIILALIPVATPLVDSFHFVKYIIALAGATASTLTGIQMVRKDKEIWLAYRGTCETLQSEHEHYKHSSGPYKQLTEDARNALFIETCEDIMTREHSSWLTLMKKEDAQ